jgi:hypothetical protein
MRTFRKYKRREYRYETNRVKMSRRQLQQILPELKRLNPLTGKDRRNYFKDLLRSVRRLRVRVHQKFTEGTRAAEIETVENPSSLHTTSSEGGTEEDAAKRTRAGTANGRISRRHVAVAHIGTGRYSQSIRQQEWKPLNA